jgi:hypothetical protein
MTCRALLVFLIAGLCGGCLGIPFAQDEVLRAKVEKGLWAQLAVGDPAEKIERVLRDQGLSYSFDRLGSRYQSVVEPKEKRMILRKVGILIFVDESGRLTKIEVRNSYTYL